MFSLESAKMTALWVNDSSTFTFYLISHIAYQTKQLSWRIFFDLIISSKSDKMIKLSLLRESDKMTTMQPNDNLTFFTTFSNSIPNRTTFVKEVFLVLKDRFVTKWHNNFHFLCDILK